MKLQERNGSSSVSINLNSTTGVMNVWGESTIVEKVCQDVAVAVKEAEGIGERKGSSKTNAVAHQSFNTKMQQYKMDIEQFRALETASAEQDKTSPLLHNKEDRRKQKQAEKDATREANTIAITRERQKKSNSRTMTTTTETAQATKTGVIFPLPLKKTRKQKQAAKQDAIKKMSYSQAAA
jgi:hypothetical protein